MKILKDFYIDETGARRCFREILAIDSPQRRKTTFEIIHYRDRAGNFLTESLNDKRFGVRNCNGALVCKKGVRKFVQRHQLGTIVETTRRYTKYQKPVKKLKLLLNPEKSRVIRLEEQLSYKPSL